MSSIEGARGVEQVSYKQPEVSRHRVLVKVLGVETNENGEELVRAVVPGWDPEREITLQVESKEIRGKLQPGTLWLAQVNLAAQQASELKPSNFELAPPPVDESDL